MTPSLFRHSIDASPQDAAGAAEPGEHYPFTLRVFLVEDSTEMRDALMAALVDIPGIVLAGSQRDADEAIAAIQAVRPDGVILDLQLATSSGLPVLAALARLAQPPRVIVLTNHPYPQYRERCLALGAEDFFDKSTEFERALEAVRRWAAPQGSPRGDP